MPVTQIDQLYIYPVKSLGGVSVGRLHFSASGVVNDRRYMLVTHQGRFITQRSHSCLSQFQLSAVEEGWRVTSRDGSSIVIREDDSTERTLQTKVWSTELIGREKSASVSEWFSQQLDELVYLIEMDDLESRLCHFNGHRAPFNFADGYPLLITNLSSLASLNTQMNSALEMTRFRPNIVVNLPDQLEYRLTELTIEGGGELLLTKPCERCNMPAIDPKTSVYQREVHKQMKEFLRRDEKVIFGMNAIAVNTTELRVGQTMEYSA